MRDFLNRSFRTKLLVSFLLIGMVPLLLCTVLMLGIFQSSLHRSVADTAQTQLDALCGDLDGLLDACAQVMDRLRSSGRVRSALVSRNRIRVKERDGKSETGKGRESQSYQGKQRTSMRRPPRRGRALSSSTRTAARGSSGGFLYS